MTFLHGKNGFVENFAI